MDTITEAELADYVDRLRAEMRAAYHDQRAACEHAVLIMRRLVAAEALLATFREPHRDLVDVLQALAGEHRSIAETATHEPERWFEEHTGQWHDVTEHVESYEQTNGSKVLVETKRGRGKRGPDRQPRKRRATRGGRPAGEHDAATLAAAGDLKGDAAVDAVADAAGIPWNTARSRLKRARARAANQALGTALQEVVDRYDDKPAETPAVPAQRPRSESIDHQRAEKARRAKKAASKPEPRFPENTSRLEWDNPKPKRAEPSIDEIPRRAIPRTYQGAT